jgi:hypothetical protein
MTTDLQMGFMGYFTGERLSQFEAVKNTFKWVLCVIHWNYSGHIIKLTSHLKMGIMSYCSEDR